MLQKSVSGLAVTMPAFCRWLRWAGHAAWARPSGMIGQVRCWLVLNALRLTRLGPKGVVYPWRCAADPCGESGIEAFFTSLVPSPVVLVIIAILVFTWAVDSGPYDDLGRPRTQAPV